MPPESFLHRHPNFNDLIGIVGKELKIDPGLVEKDYWIMHCLYGLQQLGMILELKGGTSLSKGFGIIDRFSEDIDIRIEPPKKSNVKTGRNHDSPAHCESRRGFYDYLANSIVIDGIESVTRDTEFDDANGKYRSGGIRLSYAPHIHVAGLKPGILLEVGFDDVAPNDARDISSWAYDHAAKFVPLIDNRAKQVSCYLPGYTLVEKLQTISTKYRTHQEGGKPPANYMRHYYDVYQLLQRPEVIAFVGTSEYNAHKERRFRTNDNRNISENEAFRLSDQATRGEYRRLYHRTRALYYTDQPDFDVMIEYIQRHAGNL